MKSHSFQSQFYGGRPYFCHRKHFKNKKTPMRGLFNLLTFLLTTGLFFAGIFYYVLKLLGRIVFDPSSQAWKNTLEKLQTRLKSQGAGALTPWDSEMLGLLSFNESNVKKTGWWDSIFEGVFQSIFQEPLVAYVGQTSGSTAVYLARTSDTSFIFRQKEKETEIWVNNQPYAIYVKDMLLSAGKSSQVIARIEIEPSEAQWPVLFDEKAAAALNNPKRLESAGPNPRALTLLRKVSKEEETALLALALLHALKAKA
jgi:hypothetical protein